MDALATVAPRLQQYTGDTLVVFVGLNRRGARNRKLEKGWIVTTRLRDFNNPYKQVCRREK